MLKPITTNQFERDIKLIKKRGKELNKVFKIMQLLLNQEKLPQKNRDHALTGNYANRRECHVEPDWLLIYKLESDAIIFERTGTHSDLFK
ncbi:type II toxin-antitoxin system YafQ family toxin [Legionella sp. PATHC035]|uniref:type II toxin-antitoxin system YafQ family toxin n=1 Tax=Legionella sp. PATHC035 TaxID=2992040 RepID=UPI002244ACD5|nr:type II toxin-antitoxin system YafQ family toxin [Legionella sp. PATHC035]MCW8410572.1 type II toxin-antitoxin system YafQ family toxin [Legionella sp. PATHC035]